MYNKAKETNFVDFFGPAYGRMVARNAECERAFMQFILPVERVLRRDAHQVINDGIVDSTDAPQSYRRMFSIALYKRIMAFVAKVGMKNEPFYFLNNEKGSVGGFDEKQQGQHTEVLRIQARRIFLPTNLHVLYEEYRYLFW